MRKTNDKEILQMLDGGKSQLEIARHFGVSPPAICKRVKKLRPPELPEALQGFSRKEQRFILERAAGATATQSALSAYECSSMDSAKNIGSQLTKRDDINEAISLIMEEEGIGRRHRIQALKRHIDNLHDTQASLKGIDIANKMDGIYIEKQIQVQVSYSELQKPLAEVEEERKRLEMELGISDPSELVDGKTVDLEK